MKEFKIGDIVWVNEQSDFVRGTGYLWWGKIISIHDAWAKIMDLSDSSFQGETFMRHFNVLALKCDN
ncbi:MAG: hypothetical protein KDD94_07150 [Calditrichaeota bacterium]|nr:hypothetical protein [Calditrichota bacterium]